MEKLIYSPAEVEALLRVQREKDVRRAKEWLRGNLGYYDRREIHIGKTYEDVVVEDFCKAMEEE